MMETMTEKFSFIDTLVGHANLPAKIEIEEWLSNDEGDRMEEEENEDLHCPKIKLSKEEKIRIRKPWKRTFIIKLLGRSIGYKTLWSRMETEGNLKSDSVG